MGSVADTGFLASSASSLCHPSSFSLESVAGTFATLQEQEAKRQTRWTSNPFTMAMASQPPLQAAAAAPRLGRRKSRRRRRRRQALP